jgi:hypothetical protein
MYIGPKQASNCINPVHFNGHSISEVESFTYLGLLYSNDGSVKKTKSELYNKGLKAYFKLSRSIGTEVKVGTMLHLFDHLIKPILLYGAEIFGGVSLKTREPKPSSDARKLFFQQVKKTCPIIATYMNADDPLEKLHLKFCRKVLIVHSKTTNLGIYGELGRLPLFIDQIMYTMKYTYHLEFSCENKILNEFYVNAKSMSNNKVVSFAENIHKLANLLPPSNAKEASKNIRLLKKRLEYEFQLYWREMVSTDYAKGKIGNNKLRSYKMYKFNFKMERYLDIPNPVLRRSLSQLRLSAHRLKIETGRYNAQNQYIPPANRICENCEMHESEDEMHFILKCPTYKTQRDKLFMHMVSRNIHFVNYNDVQKFTWLMLNEDLEDLKALANYISEAMALRK